MMNYHHDMNSLKARQAAFNRVLELVMLLNDDMDKSFARDGLTTSRAHLLWVLHEGGPTTQRALADALDVSPRNITGLVDAMAATGLLTREPHPADRRATLVTLTDRGATLAAHMEAGHIELSNVMFGHLSDADFDCLTRGLGSVTERLRIRLEKEDYGEDGNAPI